VDVMSGVGALMCGQARTQLTLLSTPLTLDLCALITVLSGDRYVCRLLLIVQCVFVLLAYCFCSTFLLCWCLFSRWFGDISHVLVKSMQIAHTAGGSVVFSNCNFNSWDHDSNGNAAIHASAGSLVVSSCDFQYNAPVKSPQVLGI